MKKRVLVLMVGFLFIGVNGFAADGDLIVNGNSTVGGNSTVSGNATVNGNVGIGTNPGSYKLDVSGTLNATTYAAGGTNGLTITIFAGCGNCGCSSVDGCSLVFKSGILTSVSCIAMACYVY